MSQTVDHEEPYAEGTLLLETLGGGTKVRILTVLISEADRDLNASEVCRQAGIGSSAFYDHIDDLLAYDLVTQTRKVGNSPMYRINTDSPATKALARFEWELIEFIADKEQAGELDEDNRPLPPATE